MSEHGESRIQSSEPDGVAVMAAAQSPGDELPSIALLYTDDALLAHVDAALASMAAPVVYRAPLAQADRAALMAAGAQMVLINLDDRGCDEKLDAVTDWLDGAGVPVVFNDAEISCKLEGWAQARWARHLAAKLRGSEDVDPPRPANASQAPAQSDLRPPSPASGEKEESAQETVAPIAALPLTPNEIESLVAYFPGEAVIASEDTEALAAHVDALLADAADSAAPEPAPWETIAPVEPVAVPAAANGSVSAPAIEKAPSFSNWQLVDDTAPVVSAPREKPAQAASAMTFADFKFDLEPIEEVVTPAIVRERISEELRLEEAVAKREGQKT